MNNFECKEFDRKFHSADALNSHNLAKHPKINTPIVKDLSISSHLA